LLPWVDGCLQGNPVALAVADLGHPPATGDGRAKAQHRAGLQGTLQAPVHIVHAQVDARAVLRRHVVGAVHQRHAGTCGVVVERQVGHPAVMQVDRRFDAYLQPVLVEHHGAFEIGDRNFNMQDGIHGDRARRADG